jgi:hypothetical protein
MSRAGLLLGGLAALAAALAPEPPPRPLYLAWIRPFRDGVLSCAAPSRPDAKVLCVSELTVYAVDPRTGSATPRRDVGFPVTRLTAVGGEPGAIRFVAFQAGANFVEGWDERGDVVRHFAGLSPGVNAAAADGRGIFVGLRGAGGARLLTSGGREVFRDPKVIECWAVAIGPFGPRGMEWLAAADARGEISLRDATGAGRTLIDGRGPAPALYRDALGVLPRQDGALLVAIGRDEAGGEHLVAYQGTEECWRVPLAPGDGGGINWRAPRLAGLSSTPAGPAVAVLEANGAVDVVDAAGRRVASLRQHDGRRGIAAVHRRDGDSILVFGDTDAELYTFDRGSVVSPAPTRTRGRSGFPRAGE